MEYNNVINLLLNEFPKLSQIYENEKLYCENLPHVVFGILFVNYFIGLINDECAEIESKQAAEFIEKMVTCTDNDVNEVAVVSVLEELLPERQVLRKARSYFGENTIKILDDLEEKTGWKNNIT